MSITSRLSQFHKPILAIQYIKMPTNLNTLLPFFTVLIFELAPNFCLPIVNPLSSSLALGGPSSMGPWPANNGIMFPTQKSNVKNSGTSHSTANELRVESQDMARTGSNVLLLTTDQNKAFHEVIVSNPRNEGKITQSSQCSFRRRHKFSLNEYWEEIIARHGTFNRIPPKTIARIALNLLQAIPRNSSSGQPAFGQILTFDHFVVIRADGCAFDADELGGGALIKFRDAKLDWRIGDPRLRQNPEKQQRSREPFVWLKDVRYMSPQQIKDNLWISWDKDIVWFIGLFLYRALFNKHPLDEWEPKRRLDIELATRFRNEHGQFTRLCRDFPTNFTGFEPIEPTQRWQWMPEEDETGEMDQVEARVEWEQWYIGQLRQMMAEMLKRREPIHIGFLYATPDRRDKLITVAKGCLQTFPEHRPFFEQFQKALEAIANE